MNVASLENCKRLYELSGWNKAYFKWIDKHYPNNHWMVEPPITAENIEYIPAYDAGYLLRKIPGIELYDCINCYQAEAQGYRQVADTPEDALCLLAIQLFEKNILTRDGK